MKGAEKSLVMVSNRLPVVLERAGESWKMRASAGGLVSALTPVLGGGRTWIGWSGTAEDLDVERLLATETPHGYPLKPVFLSEEERAGFYCGFANEVLWPLFHDLQSRCDFRPSYWEIYQRVNRRFAMAVAQVAWPNDLVWVHDYHLMLVGRYLREFGVRRRTGFFLHIPFPAPDLFEKLPWRQELLEGLLAYGLVGFQTARDRRNFLHCVRRLLPGTRMHRQGSLVAVEAPHGSAWVGAFPISIDFATVKQQAEETEAAHAAARMRADLSPCRIVLGVDRLDYTKGVPERLQAFRELLHHNPEMRQRVVLVQVVVPSREDIQRYRDLKLDIERLVSQINGEYGQTGWVPVHYLHRQLKPAELFAYYRAADVALITPLKDGMNLVAKEYCAARVDEDGVLVLSEFAGAAAELDCGAILVNPYHIEGVAGALNRALLMEEHERQARMQRMRQMVSHHSIFRWFNAFLAAVERMDWQSAPRPSRPPVPADR